MASVWYIGDSDRFAIRASEFSDAGIPLSSSSDVVWNVGNGWSHPTTDFTSAQLLFLQNYGDFYVTAPDGARTGAWPKSQRVATYLGPIAPSDKLSLWIDTTGGIYTQKVYDFPTRAWVNAVVSLGVNAVDGGNAGAS